MKELKKATGAMAKAEAVAVAESSPRFMLHLFNIVFVFNL